MLDGVAFHSDVLRRLNGKIVFFAQPHLDTPDVTPPNAPR